MIKIKTKFKYNPEKECPFLLYLLTDRWYNESRFFCACWTYPSQVWTVIDTSFCCLRVGTQDLQPNGQKEKKNWRMGGIFVKKKSAETNAILIVQ